jgi:2-polyprenyl-6-methoxyphenol hydroxylase-like FAD-dependent oxidoreductase
MEGMRAAMTNIELPVLIVGAGPIGLTVAHELGQRGIRCMLVEQNPGPTCHPKMDVTNTRAMEHFRRLGIAEILRDAAVRRDNSMDVTWYTSLSGWELARFQYPSVTRWRQRIQAINDGTQPLEPYMRISQAILEPALARLVAGLPSVDSRFSTRIEGFRQDSGGVTATLCDAQGQPFTLRCAYLIGCDGAASTVRRGLDIDLHGDQRVAWTYMIHFKSKDRHVFRQGGKSSWHYQLLTGAIVIAQDDLDTYTCHVPLAQGASGDSLDPAEVLQHELGRDFQFEILLAGPWAAHLLVADRYGRGRVWLAGDACHQFIPVGGYGMNTGICDAVNVAWKVAARVEGWGGPGLMDSIDPERRPIGERNMHEAWNNTKVRLANIQLNDRLVHQDSAAGARRRHEVASAIYEHRNDEQEALGIELDNRYRGSPIICAEDGEPGWQRQRYVPSSWPGVRPPSVFLRDGSALFDHFHSHGFTLLRLAETPADGLMGAALKAGMPLRLLDVRDGHVHSLYERNLVLIRPDQHVAWRGDCQPEDSEAVVDRVRGAAT